MNPSFSGAGIGRAVARVSEDTSARKTAETRKGRPVARTAPQTIDPKSGPRDYIALVVVVVEFDIIMVSFAIMVSLPIMVSFAIMPVLAPPSSVVMESFIVPMSPVVFMSVTIVLSVVVVSVFGPQADTASAAPAMSEPVRTLEMIARIRIAPLD
ncbi:hypothetical protein [Sphingomonas bacterium]|uniref:hypothetical protein n=1 Tax=Sphingomonas bacterium TaxID=1895847 RepID=UPI0026211DB7|nr:hypothetical protein [Sphingomonas bacterium]